MKKYQSHKVVEAARITEAAREPDRGPINLGLETGERPIFVGETADRIEKCLDGDDYGYLIRYSDGYVSWSPSKAFEEGYTPVDDGEGFPSGPSTPLVQVPLDYEGNRVTPERLEALVVGEEYLRTDANTLTVCVLTLRNGFTVTGQSACADPANYDRDLGESIARENAIKSIWPLEGYLLRELLWRKGGAG